MAPKHKVKSPTASPDSHSHRRGREREGQLHQQKPDDRSRSKHSAGFSKLFDRAKTLENAERSPENVVIEPGSAEPSQSAHFIIRDTTDSYEASPRAISPTVRATQYSPSARRQKIDSPHNELSPIAKFPPMKRTNIKLAGLHKSPTEGQLVAHKQQSQSDSNQGYAQVISNMCKGSKIEISLSILAALIFLGLWIFLMTGACKNVPELLFWLRTFILIGALIPVLVIILPRSPMFSCFFYSGLTVASCLNLIGAYISMGCLCKCTRDAFTDGGPDLIILIIEACGAFCLIAILLLAGFRITSPQP